MKRRIIVSSIDAGRTIKQQRVNAAEGQSKGQEAFDEAIDNLQDNFDYVIDGLDKLSRAGGESQSQALQLALEMNSAVESVTQKIASAISK